LADDEGVVGAAVFAVPFGAMAAAIVEGLQLATAKGRDKLHLQRPLPEPPDVPPDVIGVSLDWSRLALVAAIGALWAAFVSISVGPAAAVACGLALSLTLASFAWFGKSALHAPVQGQRKLFRKNLGFGLARGALYSLVVPALFIPIVLDDSTLGESGSEQHTNLEIAVAIVAWVVLFVALFAAVSVLIAPCGQYLLGVILLAVTRRLPWRPIRFFHEMRGYGLLRSNGLGYEFRHARLRDVLAGPPPSLGG
jgi:hypothetical protein